jgi:NhaA family Na+:H+ antiporter
LELGSWAAVRLGLCRLPPALTWSGVALVGCLGGIGFTMSVFIANLAFQIDSHLGAAKAGVLLASVTAAIVGLVLGRLRAPRAQRRDLPAEGDASLDIARVSEEHGR